MAFTGNGRGCNTITGTFTVNRISVGVDNTLHYLSLDFEHHLRGRRSGPSREVPYLVPGVDTTPPAKPKNLTVTRDPTGGSATICWTNPPSDLS